MPTFHFDILAGINLLGVIQGLFLAIVFLSTRQGNKVSNRLLGFLLFIQALIIFEIFACYTNLIVYFPFFINTTEPLDFLIGPIAYLYTVSLIQEKFNLKKHWIHFLPAFIYLILRTPYLLQSNEFKLADVAEVYHRIADNNISCLPILWFPEHHFGGVWMDLLTFPSVMVYFIYSYYLIFKVTRKRNGSFWNNSDLILKWLVRIFTLSGITVTIVYSISFSSSDDMGDIYIATYLASTFYVISFILLKNSHIISAPQIEAEKKKYEKSGLNEKVIPELVDKIAAFMDREKPYLNSNLSLAELADLLNLSTHHLSRIINEQLGRNFSDFVNEYRIEELKRKLHDSKYNHLKIEELAYESGFNSKSVFSIAFKKSTGTTPSQFRKSEVNI